MKVEVVENSVLHAKCLDWQRWSSSRKFYAKPPAQNILARMQPSNAGEPPDAANDPEMVFFNMAVNTLAELSEYRDCHACFVSFYVLREKNIKAVAARMKIGRRTYYDRMNKFAKAAWVLSKSIQAAGCSGVV